MNFNRDYIWSYRAFQEWQLYEFCFMYLRHYKLKGSYIEYGVGQGNSLVQCHKSNTGQVDWYYGYDTFEGLPQVMSCDDVGFKKGDFKFTMLYLNNLLKQEKMNGNTTLISGIYPESRVKNYYSYPVLIRVDFDLVYPIKQALIEACTIIQEHGLIIIDDYALKSVKDIVDSLQSLYNGNGIRIFANFNKQLVLIKEPSLKIKDYELDYCDEHDY